MLKTRTMANGLKDILLNCCFLADAILELAPLVDTLKKEIFEH